MTKAIEEYIQKIENICIRFREFGVKEIMNELTPEEINKGLARWYNSYCEMTKEYRRRKIEYREKKSDYKAWWDRTLIETRQKIKDEYGSSSRSTKPAVSEVETRARVDNHAKYSEYEREIMLLEETVAFYRRIVDKFDKHADNLRTLSSNMKSEMNNLQTGI